MITPTIPTQPRQMSSVISVCVTFCVCEFFWRVCLSGFKIYFFARVFFVCVYLDSRFAGFKVVVVVTLLIWTFVGLNFCWIQRLLHSVCWIHDFAGVLTICWLQLAWTL